MEGAVRAREEAVDRPRTVCADPVEGDPGPAEGAVGEEDLSVQLRVRRLLSREGGSGNDRGQEEG